MKNSCISMYILLLFLSSCKDTKKGNITRLVKEWEGKEIIFPNDIVYTIYGKDTIVNNRPKADYTIVTYIDSMGCTSCKIQLDRWKSVMMEIDSLVTKSVLFQFVFHSKDKKDLHYLFKRDKFDYPVWIDEDDSFNRINNFPKNRLFYTFLLDNNNKVIALGDPIRNPQIKKMYIQIIKGEESMLGKAELKTAISIEHTDIDYGEFDWREKQKSIFPIINTGDNILIINDIIASCGCMKVEYTKEPILPGARLELIVTYKADYPEYIDKIIKIYANIDNSPLRLRVKGVSHSVNPL
ncbi:DUF1573 domain-containing protein [Bacteroides sp. OttesenSCG-928-J23]|nr:DUF1573 domain-containing protein [Bacteroides sp. OttesenSCG-928-J23]MDL2306026.1 DUF1573 domain-containing protein [Bacteroides sp. OttesenSCG-928-D19]